MNAILNAIESACKRLHVEAYLVGGTVRDRLAGRTCHDWDFVCRHAERVSKAVSRRVSAKRITLDEQHRIYRVILPGHTTLDFAELQGKTLKDDLARRDFTINAMASPLRSDQIVDPFHGQRDLKKKILRAVSHRAFQEDPLRLLRAFRLMAQFELRLEGRTRTWIRAEHQRLGTPQVARERVREELLRLWSQPQCAKALVEMDRVGLLTVIFPELEAGRRVGLAYYGKGGVLKHQLQSVGNLEWIFSRIDELKYFETAAIRQYIHGYIQHPVGGYPRAALLKLGALLHDLGKPATAQVIKGRLRFFGHEEVGSQMVLKILNALRFSRQEGGLVRSWVRNHMRAGSLASAPRLTDKAMARFFYDMGEEGVGMLLVSLGDHYTYLARSKWGKGTDPVEQTVRRLLSAYYIQRETVLPPRLIDGHFLMKKLRLKPGPVIGTLLEAVREGQAAGKVRTVQEALAWAGKKLASRRPKV